MMHRGLAPSGWLLCLLLGLPAIAQPPGNGTQGGAEQAGGQHDLGSQEKPGTGNGEQEVPEEGEVPGGQEEFSLEELMDIEVTSVAKKSQKLSQSAAAIFVVTQEDIQRLHAETIADALRIVPGLHVAQITRGRWSVSARGFSGEFANNLLTQMDGRTLYNGLFAGTYWDNADTFMPDIDRIEVIRGPGATLWGANAVNGIISVITKHTSETHGGIFGTGWSDNDNTPWAQFRYGDSIGEDEDAHFRVWGKWFDRDGGLMANGDDFNDDWDAWRVGFRADWAVSDDDELSFWGDVAKGHSEELTLFTSAAPLGLIPRENVVDYGSWFLQGRWTHTFNERSHLTVNTFVDSQTRQQDYFDLDLLLFNIDVEHNIKIGDRHELIWGTRYRLSQDANNGTFDVSFTPRSRTTQLFSAFIQDTISLADDALKITIGSKFEHNDFTGFEFQPNVRAAWEIDEIHTIWGSVSHAVRTPSRVEHDVNVAPIVVPPAGPMMPAFIGTFSGDSSVVSEKVTAFELGYRARPEEGLSFDLALFLNLYDDLNTNELGAPFPSAVPGVLFLPAVFDNKAAGETYGGELAVNWQVFESWRLAASYSYTQMQIHAPLSTDPAAENIEREYPHHQFNIRSYWDICEDLQLNSVLYYVDTLPNLGIPSYWRLDAQIAWQPCDNATLRAGVQNILDDRHPEYFPVLNRPPSETERRFYMSLEIRF